MTVVTGGPAHTVEQAALEVVRLACLAPSSHNTQPWAWRIRGARIELHLDPGRGPASVDPQGRNLVISCGAALHHALVAAVGLGWHPDLATPAGGTTLLATIDLTRDRHTEAGQEGLRALQQRRTDRRRFTTWPVPLHRLVQLARAAEEWGVTATPVHDAVERLRVELLVARAGDLLTREREQDVRARDLETSDGIIVLSTVGDRRLDRLRTGQALSALWLAATTQGLSVVPLSQVVEVERTRADLGQQVIGRGRTPQLMIRIGWQSIARSTLPAVPHRPLADVLLP